MPTADHLEEVQYNSWSSVCLGSYFRTPKLSRAVIVNCVHYWYI